jgi:hypothetical protein
MFSNEGASSKPGAIQVLKQAETLLDERSK